MYVNVTMLRNYMFESAIF